MKKIYLFLLVLFMMGLSCNHYTQLVVEDDKVFEDNDSTKYISIWKCNPERTNDSITLTWDSLQSKWYVRTKPPKLDYTGLFSDGIVIDYFQYGDTFYIGAPPGTNNDLYYIRTMHGLDSMYLRFYRSVSNTKPYYRDFIFIRQHSNF